MFPTSAASSITIKVSVGDDTRRIKIDLVAGISAAEALAEIEKGVRQNFCLADADNLVLKYMDDEGDTCTLLDCSVEDLATISQGKPWKIQVSLVAQPPLVAVVRAPMAPAAPAAGPAATPTAQAERAENDDDEDMMPPEWKECAAAMAFAQLPFAARAAQMDVVRTMMNTVGVERRERIVKWCCQVLEHLDLVPEATPLRPKLEAFVGGSDHEHFGDVLAELLKAWASSSSPELVKDTVAMHHHGFLAIVKQTFKAQRMCKGGWKGKGKGKCGWWMGKDAWGKGDGGMRKGEWLQRKGEWLQSKGERLKRKGEWLEATATDAKKGRCDEGPEDSAEQPRNVPPFCSLGAGLAELFGPEVLGKGEGSPEEWAEHFHGMVGGLAGLFGQPGLGKGQGVEHLHGMMGGLAGLFGQPGFGKGQGFFPGMPPSAPVGRPGSEFAASSSQAPSYCAATPAGPLAADPSLAGLSATAGTTESEAEAGIGTVATPAPAAAPPIAVPEAADCVMQQAAAPKEGGPSSKAQMLLEMGLVGDVDLALDLLRAHGGDIAQVVANLTA